MARKDEGLQVELQLAVGSCVGLVWVPGFIRLSRTDNSNEEDCAAYETWRCFPQG